MADLRTAIRALWNSPGFSLVAILTIAVGIGANTALFSAYDRLILNPVSFPDTRSLVALWVHHPKLNFRAPAVSWPRYEDISSHTTTFSSVGLSASDSFALTGSGDPDELNGLRVSHTFLPTLGVTPMIGRNFTADDDLPNGPAVCIISHDLWRTRFGSRPDIVGATITMDGRSWEVVGVLPPQHSVPLDQAQVLAPRVFEVGGLTQAQVENGAGYTQPVARLRPGVSLEQAQTELRALDRAYRDRFAARLDADNAVEVRTFVGALVGNLEPTFDTLLAAVSFVLLIACANVASLFLSRLIARDREIAVRRAIGATRTRMLRQFLTESLVFSAAAGALGTGFAFLALSGIQSVVSSQLPAGTTLTLNWRALAFTATITLCAALLVGLVPAFHASREQPADVLKDSARGSSSARAGRLRGALIVGEVALSVVLLVGSSLLLVSFFRLQRTPPGFEARGAAATYVAVPVSRYPTTAERARFFTGVIERLRANTQIVNAAAALALPMSAFAPQSPYGVAGRPVPPLPQRPLAYYSIVSDAYFDVMRIALVAGRTFTPADKEDAPAVCIVNQSFANRLFPGESALGKVMLRGALATVRAEIVGVVRDVKTNGLNAPPPDELYYPIRQLGPVGMFLVARTTGDPSAVQGAMRAAVAEVDKTQPVSQFATLEARVAQSLGVQRMVASITAIFAAVALILAAIGLYSVLACTVSQRTSEIGIRMALGAHAGRVVAMVMRQGLCLTAAGIALGLCAAAAVARLIQALLFDVRPLEPFVYAIVATGFVIVAALACLVPSLRAARIDPIQALREG